MTTQHSKPRIGLALGSGSSRGWAHIGIIRALADIGFEPDIICGSSIGAIVGASYAAGNLDKLESWVTSLSKRDVAGFFEFNFSLNGFVDIKRLRHFFNDTICAENTLIEQLPRSFASISTELESGHEVWFCDGPVLDAVLASIAMPGLFPPIKFKGKWLVDGALVNPVPISLCHVLGAEVVLAVNLNGNVVGKHFNHHNKKPEKKSTRTRQNGSLLEIVTTTIKEYSTSFMANSKAKEQPPSLFDAIAGSINITQDRITRSRMAGDPPDILLMPKLAHIGLLEYYRASEAIDEGRACVERMATEIRHVLKLN